MLDDNFTYLFAEYGKPERFKKLSQKELAQLPQTLPRPLITFLEEEGASSLHSGSLQIFHPHELKGVTDLIFGNDPDLQSELYPFAYSAFGIIHFWSVKYGVGECDLLTGQVTVDGLTADKYEAPKEITIFSSFSSEYHLNDIFDGKDRPLLKRTKAKLGQLDYLECYGFVPALGLGGEAKLDNLKRLSAPAHFSIIAQATSFYLVKSDERGALSKVRAID